MVGENTNTNHGVKYKHQPRRKKTPTMAQIFANFLFHIIQPYGYEKNSTYYFFPLPAL